MDAAIAANAILNAVYPHMSGIGGDAFWLIYDAAEKDLAFLNASGRSPQAATIESFQKARDAVLDYVKAGGSVLCCRQPPGAVWELDNIQARVVKMAGKYFVSRKTGHPIVARHGPQDFAYWYDPEKDYIVVNYGSKTLGRSSRLIPVPVSWNRISTRSFAPSF